MRDYRTLGMLLQLGWMIAFSVLIPLAVGLWLDRRLGTAPWFVLIGALVGILGGTIGIVRITVRAIDAAAEPPPGDANEDGGKEA